MSYYCLKSLDNKLVSTDTFLKKSDAKIARDTLIKAGIHCVISRTAQHPRGESMVEMRTKF